MTTPFGFDVLDLGTDEKVGENLRNLLSKGHKIQVIAVMNNGNLQAVVTPGVE